nr:MAG TPA: hypothetical protein [Caudoviricetes sp.]
MPIPSQTGIPYNKLATKSMVMDMRHKCNYKIRKNKISRTITCAFARSIAFQNPIHPIVASQPSFAVTRNISLPASLLIHRERLLNTFWSCYLQLKSTVKTFVHYRAKGNSGVTGPGPRTDGQRLVRYLAYPVLPINIQIISHSCIIFVLLQR